MRQGNTHVASPIENAILADCKEEVPTDRHYKNQTRCCKLALAYLKLIYELTTSNLE
jgi:hypothetical protein